MTAAVAGSSGNMLKNQANLELLLLRRRRRRRSKRQIIMCAKLFITEQRNQKIFALPSCESIESQQVKQPRNHKKYSSQATIWKLIATSFVIAMLFSLTQQPVDAVESSILLPTVIVRGFLNYRTTVDGTVLLFTPDAGSSSSSSQVISATRSSSYQTLLDASSSLIDQQPTRATDFNEHLIQTEAPTSANFQSSPASFPTLDEWRPITATPPLRSMQSSFRPSGSRASVSVTAPSVTSSTVKSVLVDKAQVSALNEELTQTGQPSVQADEVTESLVEASVREFLELPVTPSQVHDGSSQKKPRRPSLGFTGQSGRPPARFQPSNQQSSPAHQSTLAQSQQTSSSFPLKPAGGSLGIRRAGLSGTSSSLSSASSTTSNPLQGRLTNAQARLRNKLKRPTTPSPTATAVAASGTSSSSTIEQNNPEGHPQIAEVAVNAQSHTQSSSTNSPVVGSDEVLGVAGSSTLGAGRPGGHSSQTGRESAPSSGGESGLLSGSLLSSSVGQPELQAGQLGSIIPLGMDSFFSGGDGAESSEPQAAHQQPRDSRANKKDSNERLSGFLDQQQNAKFIGRTRSDSEQQQQQHGKLSHQLAANLAGLAPSFAAPIHSGSHYSAHASPAHGNESPSVESGLNIASNGSSSIGESQTSGVQLKLQTITRTYSTLLTNSKTRLVPLQIGSSTGVHTITEEFVMTKLLTAYQTMPAGEFILPEQTRTPFEMFKEQPNSIDNVEVERPIQAPAPSSPQVISPEPANQQEQAISLVQSSSRSPTDWLHDFSSPQTSPMEQQQNGNQQLVALLEQQAQEANLAALSGHLEPLDGLASSLDPAALLADGNIPDLNNPLVLAAAIQNPQLAAVILAAQQLRLKQRAAQKQQQQQLQPANMQQLQPSYSTTISTFLKPTTYTVRDTMYTSRLVSFRDGRTVRTRTVSEPGSVIEQVLTSTATELTPVTITIQPTSVYSAHQATSLAQLGPSSTQATLQNALIATQLAQLLARRQQQLQPSFMASAGQRANQLAALQQLLGVSGGSGSGMMNGQAQQLAANNPLLAMKLAQQSDNSQTVKQQFQPNLQQLLASMGSGAAPSTTVVKQPAEPTQSSATPPLPLGPLVSTLTSLQVRTYTVHNAFKTIYRTITSTQLIVSTLAG